MYVSPQAGGPVGRPLPLIIQKMGKVIELGQFSCLSGPGPPEGWILHKELMKP